MGSVDHGTSFGIGDAGPASIAARIYINVRGDLKVPEGIHWRDVDEDVSIQGLLQNVPAHRPDTSRQDPMTHSVRRHLRLEIDDYDATIRRFIPGYERMLAVAADAVAQVRPEHVVDLGAGTGGLSEALLERDEVGAVELLDVDPEMLARARSRLERFGDRARFTLRSYDEPFPPCDAFAASLSLHHIPTLDNKASLFRRAFEVLRPGGVLVNADVNMPEDDALRRPLYRYWADHQVRSGIPEERAWAHFDEWAEEDTYLPLDAELDALRRVGFQAERVWNDGPVGVVVARKD